jgi:phage baseplate assembly protein W
MGYGARYITLDDLNNNSFIGIGFPFNKPGIFTQTTTTKEAIKSNLFNFFLTNPGERYLNNDFGGGIRAQLFQQMDNGFGNSIKETISQQLGIHFPNIQTREIVAEPDFDNHTLKIKITYLITNTGVADRVFLELR